MCMSWTGANSGTEPVGQAPVVGSAVDPVALPVAASMQFGVTRRAIICGIAWMR